MLFLSVETLRVKPRRYHNSTRPLPQLIETGRLVFGSGLLLYVVVVRKRQRDGD